MSFLYRLIFGKGSRHSSVQMNRPEVGQGPYFAGYLYKRGKVNTAWKKRWFVLRKREGLLTYADDETSQRSTRTIDFGTMISIKATAKREDEKDSQPEIQLDAGDRVYYLRAETEEDHQQWLSELSNALMEEKSSKKGYLMKLGAQVKNWKKRWFVLKDRKLIYYRDHQDPEIIGIIDLDNCTNIALLDDHASAPTPFVIQIEMPQRTYYLVAASQQERNEWCTILKYHPRYFVTPSAEVQE